MTSLIKNLKFEIEALAKTFNSEHPRFRVTASLDELTCFFLTENDTFEFKASIHVRILDLILTTLDFTLQCFNFRTHIPQLLQSGLLKTTIKKPFNFWNLFPLSKTQQ